MKPKSENIKNNTVVIIGGGVAGMSAAQTLSDNGIPVHLIEKNKQIGGNAASWACMATDRCQDCSACLCPEMADKICHMPHVNTHLNAEIQTIEKNNATYTITFKNETSHTIETDRILLASGFKPIEPPGLLAAPYQNNPHILTTADLNHILQKNESGTLFSDSASPRVGFIQCVGSRNRENNKDYCSQVCCKISLRQIKKLIHLYPGIEISLFYIDLQVIGKETRAAFDSLAKNVELIQGVPYEIFDNRQPNKLTVIRENDTDAGRIADHFDLMVLSVGIAPPESSAGLAGMLGIPLDPWGFVHNENSLVENGLYAAGCATGPCDILTAKHQGIACAHKIMHSFDPETLPTSQNSVAVIGDGVDACKTAVAVSKQGHEVWMFGSDNKKEIQIPGIHHVPNAGFFSIKGSAGNFTLVYNDLKKTVQKQVTAVIAAQGVTLFPVGQSWDLDPDTVVPLTDFLNILEHDPQKIPQSLVFWLDYSNPESKISSRKVLLAAIELAKEKKDITIIMNKILVHGLLGQKIYDQARKLGIKFLRVDSPSDVQVKKENQKIAYSLQEKTLKNLTLSFESHWLILPETITPGNTFPMIASLIKDPLDKEGNLQSSNVRHRFINSLRKGIFYTGACHDDIDEQDQAFEIEILLSSLRSLADKKEAATPVDIHINELLCRKCLTCYRTCPHGAIVLDDDTKPYINPEACFSCGMCLASCPALAIESKQFDNDVYLNRISKGQMVVFACERSGAIASKQIKKAPWLNILTVPCVCRVSKSVLIKTLEKGAAKIILAGCHPDNCRSIEGTQKGLTRISMLNKLPGVHSSSLISYPAAANESAKFEAFIKQESLSLLNNKGHQ